MKFKSFFKFNSLRSNLLLYSFILILLMLITSVYTFYNAKNFSKKMNSMFVNSKTLNDLTQNIEDIDSELLNYLTTKNTESYDHYVKLSDTIKGTLYTFSRKISYDENQMILKDIANMTDGYLLEADAAIKARRLGDIAQYNIKYKDSQKLSGYIKSYINKLNENQFQSNTYKYLNMYDKMDFLKNLNIVIIIDTLFLNIVILFIFTKKISNPIIQLSHAAEEISKGNFDIDDVTVSVNDEIKIMSDAFNKMKNNTKSYIAQLKFQAEMESTLMEEKMNNLKMKHLLKNAELQALQSQINPHFLFNTLNAGVQLAMMEDAEKTGVFIEKVSNLFRYNLSKMNKSVTLQEEVENIRSYIYILQTRFGDLISFDIEIDQCVLNTPIPSMVIQPIFENACVHGIGDMEKGGNICLYIKEKSSFIEVKIKDNGQGIDANLTKRILKLDPSLSNDATFEKKRHTTGIGLKNVIQRMRLFYDDYDVVDIISTKGGGTEIIFKIPKKEGDYTV